jgi:hypothetical protein
MCPESTPEDEDLDGLEVSAEVLEAARRQSPANLAVIRAIAALARLCEPARETLQARPAGSFTSFHQLLIELLPLRSDSAQIMAQAMGIRPQTIIGYYAGEIELHELAAGPMVLLARELGLEMRAFLELACKEAGGALDQEIGTVANLRREWEFVPSSSGDAAGADRPRPP